MAQITLGGNPIQTNGNIPQQGSKAPNFTLVSTSLEDVSLSDFNGKKILNIFPSVDTSVCAASVRTFNEKAASISGVSVLNISADLPFAQKRFCGAEGLDNVTALSSFRSDFATSYGLEINGGPFAGLCSRVVIVLDEDNNVLHAEQVPEIGQEPNYEAALNAIS